MPPCVSVSGSVCVGWQSPIVQADDEEKEDEEEEEEEEAKPEEKRQTKRRWCVRGPLRAPESA